MSDWKPLFIAIIIIFVMGGILPLIFNDLIDQGIELDSIESRNNITKTNVEIIQYGKNWTFPVIGYVDVDPAGWFGEGFREYMLTYALVLSYIPTSISIFLSVLMIFGLIYTIVKMLPTT